MKIFGRRKVGVTVSNHYGSAAIGASGSPNHRALRLGPRPFSISVVNSFGGNFVWITMPWIVHAAAARHGPVQLDPILSIVRPQDYQPRARWLPVHSFRYNFRDRLRAARFLAGIIDALGEWSAANYGDGFELSQKSPWMRKL